MAIYYLFNVLIYARTFFKVSCSKLPSSSCPFTGYAYKAPMNCAKSVGPTDTILTEQTKKNSKKKNKDGVQFVVVFFFSAVPLNHFKLSCPVATMTSTCSPQAAAGSLCALLLLTALLPKKLIVDCGMLIVERNVQSYFHSPSPLPMLRFNKQLHKMPSHSLCLSETMRMRM